MSRINLGLSTFRQFPKKWLIVIFLVAINLALLVGLFCLSKHIHTESKENSPAITTQLTDIQSQLLTLQNEVNKPSEKIDLSSINQDFNQLTRLIEQLKSKDDSQTNQLVTESRAELTKKLDAIHQVINSLDKKQHPIQYLPVKALPFLVISIDSIQQVSVASVAYGFRTIPLEKSDSLAGWIVIQIDFGKQRMEFVNTKQEHVIVNLAVDEKNEGDLHA